MLLILLSVLCYTVFACIFSVYKVSWLKIHIVWTLLLSRDKAASVMCVF